MLSGGYSRLVPTNVGRTLVVCCLVTGWVVVLLLFIVVKIHAETTDKCSETEPYTKYMGSRTRVKMLSVITLFPNHSILL